MSPDVPETFCHSTKLKVWVCNTKPDFYMSCIWLLHKILSATWSLWSKFLHYSINFAKIQQKAEQQRIIRALQGLAFRPHFFAQSCGIFHKNSVYNSGQFLNCSSSLSAYYCKSLRGLFLNRVSNKNHSGSKYILLLLYINYFARLFIYARLFILQDCLFCKIVLQDCLLKIIHTKLR